ncbi:expressed protein [Echinococcus multilocularis]|uniref:Expressed protein n=1 Tax=Echinococcus multilocularis TaxID=6211 RepID=A0A077RC70_ECHMU|nr:expressed protein [Echinococcus multilocularis]CDI96607.1 expressed protein [Echinococcus multilocularis]
MTNTLPLATALQTWWMGKKTGARTDLPPFISVLY